MSPFSRSAGFILPVTLWLIAATGLVAAVLSEWVAQAVSNSIALQHKMESEIAFANIRNEIVFAVGRRPYTHRGLQVGVFETPEIGTSLNSFMNADFSSDHMIFMDGRPYVIESNSRYVVQIHDGRGLVDLNTINAADLRRLFEALSIAPDLSEPLLDTLMDYRDEDDLQRLSGAEARDYERLGLYAPANAQLMTPWEAQRILGWSRVPELWRAQYEQPVLTTCRVSGFNPNTAPPQALATYINDLSIDQARKLQEYREDLPFRNIRNIGDAAGVILTEQPFFFSFKPSTCLIIDLIDQESGEHVRFSLSLVPFSKSQPWQIDYVLRIPETHKRPLDRVDQSLRFPDPEEIARRSGGVDGSTGF